MLQPVVPRRSDRYPCELFFEIEAIGQLKTKVRRPQSNDIVDRFDRPQLEEHFQVEGRSTWFNTVEEMQAALDGYLVTHNSGRSHQGRGMLGRTPTNDNQTEENLPETADIQAT